MYYFETPKQLTETQRKILSNSVNHVDKLSCTQVDHTPLYTIQLCYGIIIVHVRNHHLLHHKMIVESNRHVHGPVQRFHDFLQFLMSAKTVKRWRLRVGADYELMIMIMIMQM